MKKYSCDLHPLYSSQLIKLVYNYAAGVPGVLCSKFRLFPTTLKLSGATEVSGRNTSMGMQQAELMLLQDCV